MLQECEARTPWADLPTCNEGIEQVGYPVCPIPAAAFRAESTCKHQTKLGRNLQALHYYQQIFVNKLQNLTHGPGVCVCGVGFVG